MLIIALLIFLIGIAMEEYIYGFIFATLIYLFDSNRKLQSRVTALEIKDLSSSTIELTQKDTSLEDTDTQIITSKNILSQNKNDQPRSIQLDENQAPINLKYKLPTSSKTIEVHKNTFFRGIINKLIEPLISAVLGPLATIFNGCTKIYQHYKKQGKAPVFFLTLAGIITLVMGFGYLLQYSFNEYLPPIGKVSIGYICALLILIFAVKLHKKRVDMSEYSASLIGLSVILFYMCSYFLGPYFQLISEINTFILLSLISAVGYILSKIYETRIVSFISFLGGALAPIFFTSITTNSPFLYLSFLFLLCLGTLVIAFSIRWQLLAQICLVISIALVEFVLIKVNITTSIAAIVLVHLFFYKMCLNLCFQWYKFKTSRHNCLIQLCASLAFMLVAIEQVSLNSDTYGLLLLLNAVITASIFLLGKVTQFEYFKHKDIKIIALLMSGFFAGCSLLVLISADLLSLVWGIEGLILLFLGSRFNYYSVRLEAYLLLSVATLAATLKASTWLLNAIEPLPLLLSLEFNIGYLNLVSIVAFSYAIPIIHNRFSSVITYKEKITQNYLNQISFCLLSVLFMASIACIFVEGFWLFSIFPLFALISISHKFNWPKLEKVAFLHWFLLLIPVIASGLYVDNFHFKAQTIIGQIARIEAFLALWLIAYFYRKLFNKSNLFKTAQHLDTAFFIILPICFLPSVYRQTPEFITLALWASALLSLFIFYKIQRPILWIMTKIIILTAAAASIYACYLIKFESWQGHGLSALLVGCVFMFALLWISKSFSHQITSSSCIFKNKVISLFAPNCIYWGISILILVYGLTNNLYFGLFSVVVYCISLIVLPSFRVRLKKYYGVIHKCIWFSILCLTIGLWQYINLEHAINIYTISVIYLPILLSVFYMSYTKKPLFILTRRLGLKQKTSILLCHLCLTSVYLSLIYLYEFKLTGPLVSILLVLQGTNLLFHTLKSKYRWLMSISIGYFVIATSKVLLWDISGFTVLQKVIAFMFIGCILLGSAFQFQKLKTKNA